MFQEIPYNKNQLQNQLVNSIVGSHDLVCGCKNPLYHTTFICLQKLAPELKKQEKNQLKKCLGDDTTDDAGAEGDLNFGDLDQLFAEDFGDEDTG